MRYTRHIIVGSVIGLAVAGGLSLAAILPAAMASEPAHAVFWKRPQEIFPPAFRAAGLVKPNYDYEVDDSVSTTVLQKREVTKIAYGEKSTVTIITTPTGTYSTDALESPHIQYPGITKTWVDEAAPGTIAVWSGDEWLPLFSIAAHSFEVLDDRGGFDQMFDGGDNAAVPQDDEDLARVAPRDDVWDQEVFPDEEPDTLIHPVPVFPDDDDDDDADTQVITPLGDHADETQALEGDETLPTYPAPDYGDDEAAQPGVRL